MVDSCAHLFAEPSHLNPDLSSYESFPADLAQVRRARSMYAFDDALIAPMFGFPNALEYYVRICVFGL
jgi:predicted alpha/beta-fold hydrolase